MSFTTGVPNCQNLMTNELRCCVCVCHSVVYNSLWSHGMLKLSRFLCPWNSLGKNTGLDSHYLIQGVFLTQGSNTGLQHCRQILYHLNHQGADVIQIEIKGTINVMHLNYPETILPPHQFVEKMSSMKLVSHAKKVGDSQFIMLKLRFSIVRLVH